MISKPDWMDEWFYQKCLKSAAAHGLIPQQTMNTSLAQRNLELLRDNPGYIEDLIRHCHVMMLEPARQSLKNSTGYLFWCEGIPTLVVSLKSDSLVVDYKDYLPRYCNLFKSRAGINHIRLMVGKRPIVEMSYSPTQLRWFADYSVAPR